MGVCRPWARSGLRRWSPAFPGRANNVQQSGGLYLLPHFRRPPVLRRLWRGYAAVVRLIIIVAISTGDRGGSAIVTWPVVSTRGGGTDRSGTDRSSTDAHRHARAVNTTTVDATTVDSTTNANCADAACANSTCANATRANASTTASGRLVRNGQHEPDAEEGGGSECHNGST